MTDKTRSVRYSLSHSYIPIMYLVGVLWLYSNGFSGTIPTELGNLEYLEQLLLHFNDLEGSVPSQICALPNLKGITVSCGVFDGPKCDCCVDCTDL